jgi:plastocyanin
MMTSFSLLFKTLTIVALSLLAAASPGPPARTEAAASSSVKVAAEQTAAAGPCFADATTLCLNGGRFKVQVAWSVPDQGTSGVGMGVPLTGDTGYFWFFSSNNVELVIKVVDGRAFNAKFWVFYGALSNVNYTITVTDTVAGTVKTYSNPFGLLASVADTAAFDGGASAGTGLASSEGAGWLPMGPAAARQLGEGAACVPDSTTHCLNNNRFKVQVSWRVPTQGTSGPGIAVPLTGDTGEFWFFSSNNIELVIKVVDGTAFNGRFWVFYGALSNVEYTITVTDTVTGAVKTFFNPFNSLASVADTSAFGGAPAPTPTSPGPTPTPTPTPTPSASTTRIVNVGAGGATRFTDTVTGSSSTSIRVGDTVQWNFLTSSYHSTTSGACTGVADYYNDGGCTPDGNWDSGQLVSPATYSKRFTTAGSFRYYCTVHGAMMIGTVDVNP